MSRFRLDVLLWATTAVLLAAAAWTLRAHPTPTPPVGSARTHIGLLPERISRDSVTLAAEVVTAGNLFRPDRRAGDPSVMPLSDDAPVTNKPQLTLRGLVGGPPWDVLVEGLPGREGTTVLRLGQEVSGVTAVSIRGGTATLRGYDTLWTLTFRPAP